MTRNIIILAVIVIVVVLIGMFAFNYFRDNFLNPKVKILTITDEGKVTPDRLEIANDERIRIKNEDDTDHTVKTVSNDSEIVTIPKNETSREIEFADNSSNKLYLNDQKEDTTEVVVGEVQATQATNPPPAEPTPTPAPNQPLPDTGAELFLFPLMVGVGFVLLKLKKRV